jgi:hypothetical protein
LVAALDDFDDLEGLERASSALMSSLQLVAVDRHDVGVEVARRASTHLEVGISA